MMVYTVRMLMNVRVVSAWEVMIPVSIMGISVMVWNTAKKIRQTTSAVLQETRVTRY